MLTVILNITIFPDVTSPRQEPEVTPDGSAEPIVAPPASSAPAAQRTILSDDLLQGQAEVLIRHGEEIYRLRHTRNGKLILQK